MELKILTAVNNVPFCKNWEWVFRPSKLFIGLLIPFWEFLKVAWWEEEPLFLTWFLGVDLYHIHIKGYLCWTLLWAKCCYFSLFHCWSFLFAGSLNEKLKVGKNLWFPLWVLHFVFGNILSPCDENYPLTSQEDAYIYRILHITIYL